MRPIPGWAIGTSLVAACLSNPATAQTLPLPIVDALVELDTRVTLANGRIAVLEGRADAATTTALAVDRAVRELIGTVANQAGVTTVLDGVVTTQAGALAALGARVTVQDGVLSAIDARTDAISGQVGQLGVDVVAARSSSLALSERVANVAETVSVLSGRSLAQATAIAEIDIRVGDNSAAIARERSRNDAQDATLADHSTRINRVGAVADASFAAAQSLRNDVDAGRIGVVQVAANDVITVGANRGGSEVSMAGTAGARRLSGVAAGVQADDAATLGQVANAMTSTLSSANFYTDQQVLRALDYQMGATQAMIADNNAVLRRDMNGVAAHGAALSGLPQATVPGRGFAGMSVGGKGGQVALALGVSKAFLGDHAPVLKAGAAIDTRRGDMTYNAGVGIHF